MAKHKIIYVDIDETICFNPIWNDHTTAIPIYENIDKINALYDEGHKIIYWTSRGQTTKKDWSSLTKKQFEEWGVKYHELKFGKPYYDIFICDKTINPKSWKDEDITP